MALTFSLATGIVDVNAPTETTKIIRAESHFIAFVSALVGFALFLVAVRRGKAPYKVLGLIGVCLAVVVMTVFGFNLVQESIAYAKNS